MTYDSPLGFALHIAQGKGRDKADRTAAGYFGDLTQLVLDRAISRDGRCVKRQQE